MKSVCDLVTSDRVDIVVAAMVGFSGLAPTMSAISAGKVIALANKETLVAAGSIVMGLSRKYQCPISLGTGALRDSSMPSGRPGQRHSQDPPDSVGRAFPDLGQEPHHRRDQGNGAPAPELGDRSEDHYELSHNDEQRIRSGQEHGGSSTPRWDKINVIVHPRVYIHSMVEYEDESLIAQLAYPDMRGPIQFAIGFPERLPLSNQKLDFAELEAFRSPSLTPRSSRHWRSPTRQWIKAEIFLRPERGERGCRGRLPARQDPVLRHSDIVGECIERAVHQGADRGRHIQDKRGNIFTGSKKD